MEKLRQSQKLAFFSPDWRPSLNKSDPFLMQKWFNSKISVFLISEPWESEKALKLFSSGFQLFKREWLREAATLLFLIMTGKKNNTDIKYYQGLHFFVLKSH